MYRQQNLNRHIKKVFHVNKKFLFVTVYFIFQSITLSLCIQYTQFGRKLSNLVFCTYSWGTKGLNKTRF